MKITEELKEETIFTLCTDCRLSDETINCVKEAIERIMTECTRNIRFFVSFKDNL